MKDKVIIFDTTLRDGEQSPGAALAIDEKIDLARQLERLGVDVIEAGFPFSSPGDFESVSRISEEIQTCTVCGLARAAVGDIDSAWKALQKAKKPRIHVFVPSSDVQMQNMLRQTREEVLATAVSMVARAKGYCQDIEFSPMDATRSDPDFICRLVEDVIAAGATTVNIPDTVGYTDPAEFDKFLAYIFDKVKNIDQAIISVHCHNDLGMATANSLTAIKRGARQIECTINGIGERAGNAALEEVAMALHTRRDFYGLTTNINLSEIYKTSRMVSSYTGLFVQPNKAIVGANAFAHQSGIHQDGILKERSTFEIMDPHEVGVGDSAIVLGKHSGRHAFKARLESLGYDLSAEDLNRVFLRFKKLADQKKIVVDADLEVIVADEIRSPAEVFRLDHLQVTCGDHSIPTASVRLIAPDGEIVADAALGNGPVDAIYKAINRLVQAPNRLIEFSVHSVTGGLDAVAETTIRIQSDGRVYSGRGVSTDIIFASAKAYMNALNKLLATQERAKKAEAAISEEGQEK